MIEEDKIVFHLSEDLLHLQKVLLDIAKDIDLLCRRNDIQYYLLGGSVLGIKVLYLGMMIWI